MNIVPPIIIADGLDVSIFTSVDGVIRYVEAIDVEDKVYVAFDSTGQPLELVTDGKKIFIQQSHVDSKWSLKALLIDFLVATGNSENEVLDSRSLGELLELAQQKPVTRKNKSFSEAIKSLFKFRN